MTQHEKLKKKADAMVVKVQRRIDRQGAYENAGLREARAFQDILDNTEGINWQERWNLMQYFDRKIENLRY